MELQTSLFSALTPNISVETVVFGYDLNRLYVLLSDRTIRIKKNKETITSLPFSLLHNETPEELASILIYEYSGLPESKTKQFHTFGALNRTRRELDCEILKTLQLQPDERVISIGFYALLNCPDFEKQIETPEFKSYWVPVSNIPQLAFDHNEILLSALNALKNDVKYFGTGLELLPSKFTLTQLQNLYQILLGKQLDKRNFRRKAIASGLFRKLAVKQKGVAHKPAKYFQIHPDKYIQLKAGEFNFIF